MSDSSYRPVTPIRPAAAYIGGKRRLGENLARRIEATPHETYAEPFVGMGGVFSKRQERLNEYKNPTRSENWRGESSDPSYLHRWSARASENSELAPRAKSGKIDLPPTGEITLPDSNRGYVAEPRQIGKHLDHVSDGSSFLKSIRRQG